MPDVPAWFGVLNAAVRFISLLRRLWRRVRGEGVAMVVQPIHEDTLGWHEITDGQRQSMMVVGAFLFANRGKEPLLVP